MGVENVTEVGAWIECECCGDFFCQIHEEHVYDCECPPVDTWLENGFWPYGDKFMKMSSAEKKRFNAFKKRFPEFEENED